jgi:hypothetical protein
VKAPEIKIGTGSRREFGVPVRRKRSLRSSRFQSHRPIVRNREMPFIP